MDSDDEYLPDMCQTLYDEVTAENADIVSSNFLNINKNSSKIEYNRFRRGFHKTNKIYFIDDEVYDFTDGYVTSKIFKRSVIVENRVKFPEDRIIEDSYFICLLLYYVNKIIYLKDYTGFLRHVQEDSLHKSEDYAEAKRIMDMCLNLYSFYKDNEIAIDFSWISRIFIGASLFYFYKSNILDNKKESYNFLGHMEVFEKDIGFDNSYLNISLKLSNKLIMKKRFEFAIIIFKILRRLNNNELFMKLYWNFKY